MPLRPSLQRERAAWAEETLLVGVDEAGRGPLAGPVVAAAVVFPPGCRAVRGLRDSKMLPAARAPRAGRPDPAPRARLRGRRRSSPRDRPAQHPGRHRARHAPRDRRASCRGPPLAGRPYRILIDGLPLPESAIAHEALVDGDARCQSIAAAAILAKTVRDRLMQRLAQRHPGYGWHTNVGYGTEEHQEGLGSRADAASPPDLRAARAAAPLF